jgi:small GTP-binding protein
MNNDPDYVFKIVAVGMGGVGKTSLIRRFATGKFDNNYSMTLGVDFTTKALTVNGKKVKIVCADTSGQVYYGPVRPQYYEGANAAFVVFDLTNRNSFESVGNWIKELQQYIKDVPIAIVGNKLDLTLDHKSARRIGVKEGREFCESKQMPYFETSAKTAENVDMVFTHLAKKILKGC